MEPSTITTKTTVPPSVAYCKGRVCHSFADCDIAGDCKYQSSGEAFKESRTLKTVVEEVLNENIKQIEMFDCGLGVKLPMLTTPKTTALPTDSTERKDIPLARGLLDYFPAALAEIARLSKAGNDKHNPGEDLHWARGKSMDHADCILRHLAERGVIDTDGFLHDVKVAWRALAQLQEALELRGAPKARGAR